MIFGKGYTDRLLTEREVHDLMAQALTQANLTGKRVLVIIPDHTRTAPISLFFRLFHELIGGKVAALDYLVALGTHHPMSEPALKPLYSRAPGYPMLGDVPRVVCGPTVGCQRHSLFRK